MSPEQCRKARKLVGLSRERLAAVSSTSAHFVERYENGGRVVSPQTRENGADWLHAVRAALEAAGAIFVDENGGGAGVRLRGKA